MVPVQFPVNMISTWAGSFQHTDEISHAGSLYLLYSLSALIFKESLLILNAQVRSMWQFSQNSYVLATRWANYDSVGMGTRCLVCFPGFECIQQHWCLSISVFCFFFLNQIKRLNFCQTVVSGSPPQVAQHAWCGKFFFNYTKCNHNGIYVPRWTDDLVLVTQMCKPLHCEATHLWPASRSAQCKSLFLPYTSPPLWMWIDIYTIFTSFTLDIHVVRLSEE